ncbi:GntR family transcriptional regulator [Roseibium denhamense]|uniref:Transcriptional regulator, GntR family n=1 Tax=Roseibium denhamense TaxID=76305 RepID=A0ABY1NEL1_9HYPH|nr:GntR family transcriptional regulator [Roseibium denhamense]SMP06020.1 transcriptional regulator, GntR family [Roseibium denhamense]
MQSMLTGSTNTENKQSVSAVQRIERGLLEEIGAGELAPGQRLDEAGLASRFGASRTPVREALSRLTAQGVLVQGEKRGVFVAEYSREQLSQMFEAMHEIEAACARIVAQRLDFLSRSEIEAAQAGCVKAAEAGDRTEYLRANEAFHQAIYKATGNPYMAEIASEFRQRTGPFRAKKFASREDLLSSAQSHQALLDSIFSKDAAAASKSMRDHMAVSFLETLKAN